MAHQSYDDMSSDPKAREEDRRFRTIKNIITTVIIILILLAVGAIVLLIRSDNTAEKGAAEKLDSIVIADDEAVEDALGEIIQVPEAVPAAEPDVTEPVDTPAPSEEAPVPVAPAEEPADEPAEEAGEPVEDTVPKPEGPAYEEAGEISNTPVSYTSYTVKAGDTVNRIAASYGLLPETVISVNSISDVNDIKVGMSLSIPDRDGQMYTVKAGDSLSVIAYSYGMGYVTLADVNGLKSSLIRIGERLFIPNRVISREDYQIVMNTLFTRPAEGRITYGFASSMEDIITGEIKRVDGVYIEDELGTRVDAANTGTVIAVENNQGDLGRYIVIDHDNGYQTTYGHLDRLYVEVGNSVEQGDRIGTMGNTGRILTPMLFFKITKDGVAIDPEEFF